MGEQFNNLAAAIALAQTERFYQDCHEAFDALVASINIYHFDFSSADAQMGIWKGDAFGYYSYTFRRIHEEPYRFFNIIVRPDVNALRTTGVSYREMCENLHVSPDFPLVVVYGSFRFQGDAEDIFRRELKMRRVWCRNVFRLEVLESEVQGGIDDYGFNGEIIYQSSVPANAWRCQGAKFSIKRLADLSDNQAITNLAQVIATYPACD